MQCGTHVAPLCAAQADSCTVSCYHWYISVSLIKRDDSAKLSRMSETVKEIAWCVVYLDF